MFSLKTAIIIAINYLYQLKSAHYENFWKLELWENSRICWVTGNTLSVFMDFFFARQISDNCSLLILYKQCCWTHQDNGLLNRSTTFDSYDLSNIMVSIFVTYIPLCNQRELCLSVIFLLDLMLSHARIKN